MQLGNTNVMITHFVSLLSSQKILLGIIKLKLIENLALENLQKFLHLRNYIGK